MPRIAIKDYQTSFFHVIVQGIRKEYIFNKDSDKRIYIDIMSKYLKDFNVKIIAYCVMGNHTHILIYIEKVEELSKFMRAVNTTYAVYYNREYKKVGYVFRNRYKVEPIYNQKYLINCIHYIHDNPVKAKTCNDMSEYKYSSYYEYSYNTGKIIKKSLKRFEKINLLFWDNIFKYREIDYSYMDYVEEKDFENKEEVIREFINEARINKDEIKKNNDYLEKLAIILKERCGLTHKEIANEFGVSRAKITRLINSK